MKLVQRHTQRFYMVELSESEALTIKYSLEYRAKEQEVYLPQNCPSKTVTLLEAFTKILEGNSHAAV